MRPATTLSKRTHWLMRASPPCGLRPPRSTADSGLAFPCSTQDLRTRREPSARQTVPFTSHSSPIDASRSLPSTLPQRAPTADGMRSSSCHDSVTRLSLHSSLCGPRSPPFPSSPVNTFGRRSEMTLRSPKQASPCLHLASSQPLQPSFYPRFLFFRSAKSSDWQSTRHPYVRFSATTSYRISTAFRCHRETTASTPIAHCAIYSGPQAAPLPQAMPGPSPRQGALCLYPFPSSAQAPLWRSITQCGTRSSAACAASSSVAHTQPQAGLSPEQWRQVEAYVATLEEWNQKMNLTAVRGRAAIMERHVADSLALLPLLDQAAAEQNAAAAPEVAGEQGKGGPAETAEGEREGGPAGSSSAADGTGTERFRLIDVGTGAGLPGVLLAIARPEWQVCLLDSLNKRCDFLRVAAGAASLTNVTVLCARAEDAGQNPSHRERYDTVVARAVADMRVLAPGGTFVAAKGPNPEEEVAAASKALSLLGGELKAIVPVVQISPERSLTAVICRKVKRTDPKYPRRPGMPSKRPL